MVRIALAAVLAVAASAVATQSGAGAQQNQIQQAQGAAQTGAGQGAAQTGAGQGGQGGGGQGAKKKFIGDACNSPAECQTGCCAQRNGKASCSNPGALGVKSNQDAQCQVGGQGGGNQAVNNNQGAGNQATNNNNQGATNKATGNNNQGATNKATNNNNQGATNKAASNNNQGATNKATNNQGATGQGATQGGGGDQVSKGVGAGQATQFITQPCASKADCKAEKQCCAARENGLVCSAPGALGIKESEDFASDPRCNAKAGAGAAQRLRV
ncbi:hypothetical protein CDD83_9175 [Cordyceps sp. RAO-2017]|nr:hypothetical protein CDD83_9175 [Cordyceps sp. RAO-2017]